MSVGVGHPLFWMAQIRSPHGEISARASASPVWEGSDHPKTSRWECTSCDKFGGDHKPLSACSWSCVDTWVIGALCNSWCGCNRGIHRVVLSPVSSTHDSSWHAGTGTEATRVWGHWCGCCSGGWKAWVLTAERKVGLHYRPCVCCDVQWCGAARVWGMTTFWGGIEIGA